MFSDERVEQGFVAVAISLAVVALVQGFRSHRSGLPLALGLAGIFLLVFPRVAPLDAGAFESVISIAGAALVVIAHALNLVARRRHSACCARSS